MKTKVFLMTSTLWMIGTPLLGEILSGDLVTKGDGFFIVKDHEGKERHLRFDQDTTFTVLMDSKETRVKEDIQIEPGAKVMTFEEEGYAIYFQLKCKEVGGTTSCVPADKKPQP